MTRDDDIIELGPEQDAAPAEAEPTYGPYDATNPPPLDFEAWAATSAALLERDGAAPQGLLQSRQLEPKLWDACNQFWSLELARQMGTNNFGLATRYGMLCRDELTGRAAELPATKAEPPQERSIESTKQTAFVTALKVEDPLPFKDSEDGSSE
ncbi:MAG: hypothetical protein DRI90_04635 [Deltaproteobacteria bacterium]|nr:MAG: hypothetical protein DRI90_04635 [Deltaproteobacteria bacterium]